MVENENNHSEPLYVTPIELPKQRFTKKRLLIIGLVLLLLAGGGLAAWVLSKDMSSSGKDAYTLPPADAGDDEKLKAAVKAGRQLSDGKCEGEGSVTLTNSPMKADDFAMIIPYGAVIDGHVTPIDHQYFSPADFNSKPDTYPVYALADGRITQISHRSESVGSKGKPSNDYRFVFAHTCTFLTYFDLVTSLAPDIQAEYDKNKKSNGFYSSASLEIPVKAGQLVGYIGGQTLDFAVWDTTKPLRGFITPELYKGEAWKIYTADPLDYYGKELKELAISKYLRTDSGKSGKIDWDIDGKLIGNWFAEGSNGYEGDRQRSDGRYWAGHLAIAPDYLDQSYYIASFGSFKQSGDGEQFVIKSAQPDPKDVGIESGPVKYELVSWSYMANGSFWDRKSLVKDPKISIEKSETKGCALFQLIENRKLKGEPFPDKPCSKVSGFTSAATTYIR